jgi:predicted AlkP superfamily phosphohydrolase/phosphomutase
VIVLGVDAMDPGFVERHWMDLPNLARLAKTGAFHRLATTVPPQSPVAWSTFITGMNPGGHGIFDFVHRDPATMKLFSSMGEVEPPTRTFPLGPYEIPLAGGRVRQFRSGRAFWQTLGEHGIPVVLLRMPNNFPPVANKGRTLSGMGTPDLSGTFGTFTFYTDDPVEAARDVSGGRIVPIKLEHDSAAMTIEGPENTLRKDRARSSVTLIAYRDPTEAAALFEIAGNRFLLREGEWSGWIRVRFPIIPGIKSAAGMVRIFAKKIHPEFEIYVSPVNIDPSDPELPISTPSSYSRELARVLGPFYTQGIAEDTAALRQHILSRDEYREQSGDVLREQFAMLERELATFRSGLLFIHFLGIDQDSHVLWGKYDRKLLTTYQRVDAEVGRVMEKAEGALLLVISDHGFSRFDRAVNVNTWLMNEGFLALAGGAKQSAGEILSNVDWSKTRAYAVGLNAIYLNLRNREKNGIVNPGAEATETVDEIRLRLLALHDPANGNAAAAAVYRRADVYSGEAMASAPDLVVGWSAGYRTSWQSALGEISSETIEDNYDEWRGDHCIASDLVPGVVFSNRVIRLPNPRLEDLTTTLLAEFGIQSEPGMKGRSIF